MRGIFRRRWRYEGRRRRWIPSASSAAVLVIPGAGSLVIEGFAPTISTPVLLTPDTGQLVLTGYAPTVTTSAPIVVAAPFVSPQPPQRRLARKRTVYARGTGIITSFGSGVGEAVPVDLDELREKARLRREQRKPRFDVEADDEDVLLMLSVWLLMRQQPTKRSSAARGSAELPSRPGSGRR
jgi:hypothetical protein